MCPRTDGVKRPEGYMSFGLFKKIVDEVAAEEFEYIGLVGYGENLMHPEIERFIIYAKEKNVNLFLVTNGLLLNQEKAKALLDTGIDRIIFSVDASNSETYKKVKGGGDFQVLYNNISYFMNLRDSSNLEKPRVQLQMLRMEETENEINEYVLGFKPLIDPNKGDCLYLKEVQTWAGQTSDRRSNSTQTLPEIKETLIKQGVNCDGVVTESWQIPSKRSYCRHLSLYMVIYYNGEVSVCCRDIHGCLIVGDISKSSIRDVWNNEKYELLRKKDSEQIYENICVDCNDWFKAR